MSMLLIRANPMLFKQDVATTLYRTTGGLEYMPNHDFTVNGVSDIMIAAYLRILTRKMGTIVFNFNGLMRCVGEGVSLSDFFDASVLSFTSSHIVVIGSVKAGRMPDPMGRPMAMVCSNPCLRVYGASLLAGETPIRPSDDVTHEEVGDCLALLRWLLPLTQASAVRNGHALHSAMCSRLHMLVRILSTTFSPVRLAGFDVNLHHHFVSAETGCNGFWYGVEKDVFRAKA